jgi:uncharacterized protein YjiK
MKNSKNFLWYLGLITALWLLLAVTACKPKSGPPVMINGYNLAAPIKFLMPESLFEISGISFNNGRSDTVYAVQDEEGKVYKLAWGIKKQQHTRFGKDADYEDLAIAGNKVFVLKSNGTLLSFLVADMQKQQPEALQEWSHLLPPGEYEGLYADAKNAQLFVMCKNCNQDEAAGTLSVYQLPITDSPVVANVFTLKTGSSNLYTGGKKSFRPSGFARHPATGDWYIISAVNKQLLVADSNWNITNSAPLKQSIFAQPEGIAFDSKANLYISNEGNDVAAGNILKFTAPDNNQQK